MTIEFVDSRKHQAKIDARFDHRHYISQCMAPARSAIEEIFEKYKVPVKSIIDLDNIIDFLKKDIKNKKVLDQMLGYKQKYGV